jgi:hypothetical protein
VTLVPQAELDELAVECSLPLDGKPVVGIVILMSTDGDNHTYSCQGNVEDATALGLLQMTINAFKKAQS